MGFVRWISGSEAAAFTQEAAQAEETEAAEPEDSRVQLEPQAESPEAPWRVALSWDSRVSRPRQ